MTKNAIGMPFGGMGRSLEILFASRDLVNS